MDLAALRFSPHFVGQINGVSARGLKLPYVNVSGIGTLADGTLNFRYDDIHDLAANFTNMVRAHTMRFGVRLPRLPGELRSTSASPRARSASGHRGRAARSTPRPARRWARASPVSCSACPTAAISDVTTPTPSSPRPGRSTSRTTGRSAPSSPSAWAFATNSSSPLTERFNRSVRGLRLRAPQARRGTGEGQLRAEPDPRGSGGPVPGQGGLTFAGVNGTPRALWSTDKNNFMPRIGFAYSRQSEDRAARRLRHLLRPARSNPAARQPDRVQPQHRFRRFASTTARPIVATLTNPFPSGLIARGRGSGTGDLPRPGHQLLRAETDQRPICSAGSSACSASCRSRSVIEVSYVGNRGTKQRIRPATAIRSPRQYLSTSPVRDQATIDYLSAQRCRTPSTRCCRRPSLAGTTVAAVAVAPALPAVHRHQLTTTTRATPGITRCRPALEKRFAQGYTLSLSWTWSKFMEATGYLNETDPLAGEGHLGPGPHASRWSSAACGSCRSAAASAGPGRATRPSRRVIGGWQVQGDLPGPERTGARLRQRRSSPETSTTFRSRRASARSTSGSTSMPASSALPARQLGSNIRTLSFALLRHPRRRDEQLGHLGDQEHATSRSRCELQFRTEFVNA